MPQLYPLSVSNTTAVTINTTGSLTGGGPVPLGGSITLGTGNGVAVSERNVHEFTAAPDGTTQSFTIANVSSTLDLAYVDVYQAGLLLTPGVGFDYQLSGNVVNFTVAPPSGTAIYTVFAQPTDNRQFYQMTSAAAVVIIAPSTSGEPVSSTVTMTANGTSVPAYLAKTQSLTPSVTNPTLGVSTWGQFDFTGTVNMVINQTGVTSAVVKTIQGGVAVDITPTLTSSSVSFPLSVAGQYYIEINGDWANSVWIFANPMQSSPPQPTDPGVQVVSPGSYSSIALTGGNNTLYFGPGQYFLTGTAGISLTAGQSVYGADGAFLYGSRVITTPLIQASGAGGSITGRMVLDNSQHPGNGYATQYQITSNVATVYAENQFIAGDTGNLENSGTALDGFAYTVLASPAPTSSQFSYNFTSANVPLTSMVGQTLAHGSQTLKLDITTGCVVNGIILRDACGFSLWDFEGSGATISNVKVLGWRLNADGIDPDGCTNVTISNSTVRNFDDSISFKTNQTPGGNLSTVTVSNMLFFRQNAHTIAVGSETYFPLSNVTVNGIRVVRDQAAASPNAMIGFTMGETGGLSNFNYQNITIDECQRFLAMNVNVASSISNVTLNNITLPTPLISGPVAVLDGFGASNKISNTTLSNIVVNGSKLLLSQVSQNAFVTGTVVTP